MCTHRITQYTFRYGNYPHKHGYVFTQAGIEQFRVDPLEKALRVKDVVAGLPFEVALQTIGQVFQQHSDKGRTGTVAGNIGDVHQHLVFGDAEIIEEIAAQVERGFDLVVHLQPGNLQIVVRKHSQLHFAPGVLVCPQLRNTAAQLPVGFRSEEHTSELQSRPQLVCRLLLEHEN